MERPGKSWKLPPIGIRQLHKVAVDLVLLAAAFMLAFYLRFDFAVPAYQMRHIAILIGPVLVAKLVILYFFGAYRTIWRYVSTSDIWTIILATFMGTAALIIIVFGVHRFGFPRSVVVLDAIISVAALAGVRLAARSLLGFRARSNGHRRVNPVLIFGAGTTGESIIREMLQRPDVSYYPVGIIDDDRAKQGLAIHGVRVIGTRRELPRLIQKHQIKEVFICAPTISREVIRDVYFQCDKEGVLCKTLPGIYEIIDGRVSIDQVRRVQIEDILGREPVKAEMNKVEGYLSGKSVMVTGAGGSIGSELCRQISRLNPSCLAMVDQDEGALFNIEQQLKGRGFAAGVPILADVGDSFRTKVVIDRFKPEVVFHAAAYKHVPMTEANPLEAIRNNLLATGVLAERALASGVDRFIYISTDKAVEPVSILGITKALGEKLMQHYGQRGSATRFVTVRFGNVLDSSGSVIPIFREQIAKGGPVTVTHAEMYRYFMTIPEAVHLVLQAGAMGKGGETFVLNMGEQVSILEMAKNMIRLSGFEPEKDIPIEFTGIRPGERLNEKLFWDDEEAVLTEHKSILVARNSAFDSAGLDGDLALLAQCIFAGDEEAGREHVNLMCQHYFGTVPRGPHLDQAGSERLT